MRPHATGTTANNARRAAPRPRGRHEHRDLLGDRGIAAACGRGSRGGGAVRRGRHRIPNPKPATLRKRRQRALAAEGPTISVVLRFRRHALEDALPGTILNDDTEHVRAKAIKWIVELTGLENVTPDNCQ